MNADRRRYRGNPDGLSGEWWIDDSGFATFADGDVGDQNHEGIAFFSALEWDPEESSEKRRKEQLERDWDEVLELKKLYPDDTDLQEADAFDLAKCLDDVYAGNGIDNMQAVALEVLGANAEAIKYFRSHMADAREYMMEKQGWIRVANSNFQMHVFDDDALGRIKDFLGDEYPEDENLEEDSFGIEELSTGKYFSLSGEDIMNSGKTAGALKFSAAKANPPLPSHWAPQRPARGYYMGYCNLCHAESRELDTFRDSESGMVACESCARRWEAHKRKTQAGNTLWEAYIAFQKSMGQLPYFGTIERHDLRRAEWLEAFESGRNYRFKKPFEAWLAEHPLS